MKIELQFITENKEKINRINVPLLSHLCLSVMMDSLSCSKCNDG